ncbi:MAG: CoA-binding protein [Burkholderiales bacterium]
MEINDEKLVAILTGSRSIAVVGLSPRPERPSNQVARYLIAAGYRVIPVNPGHTEILGLRCYGNLKDVPGSVDIVDCFRRSESIPPIAEDAVAIGARVLWLQLGVVNKEAAERAERAGLIVVVDRCIKIDHAVLGIGARKAKGGAASRSSS